MIPYASIISYAALGLACAWGGWSVQSWRMGEQIQSLKTEYATAQARAVERAHSETIRLQAQADKAAKQSAARQAKMADDAARARSERDGLRDELSTARSQLPDASCTSVRDHAATLNTVFGECAAAIEGLAGQAQGHAIDTLKLIESWPSGTTVIQE